MTIEEAIEQLEIMIDNRIKARNGYINERPSIVTQALLIAIKTMKEQTERPDYRKP